MAAASHSPPDGRHARACMTRCVSTAGHVPDAGGRFACAGGEPSGSMCAGHARRDDRIARLARKLRVRSERARPRPACRRFRSARVRGDAARLRAPRSSVYVGLPRALDRRSDLDRTSPRPGDRYRLRTRAIRVLGSASPSSGRRDGIPVPPAIAAGFAHNQPENETRAEMR